MPVIFVAKERGIESLFHYQPTGPSKEEPLKYLEHLLLGRRLRLSDPSRFNDPWDCRPRYSTESLDTAEGLKRYQQWAFEIFKGKGDPDSIAAHKVGKYASDAASLRRQLSDMDEKASSMIRLNYRIYCASPEPDNLLMWAHYADSHAGVCVEFSTSCRPFHRAFEVRYSNDYPAIEVWEDGEAHVHTFLLTKSSVWSYEQEYRLVGVDSKSQFLATLEDPLIVEGDDVGLSEFDSIRSITCGMRMDPGLVGTVRELVARTAPHVEFRVASAHPSRYEIEIKTAA